MLKSVFVHGKLSVHASKDEGVLAPVSTKVSAGDIDTSDTRALQE